MAKKAYINPQTTVTDKYVITECLCQQSKNAGWDFEDPNNPGQGTGGDDINPGEGEGGGNFIKGRGSNDYGSIW